MMHRFQCLLSVSTCAATTWGDNSFGQLGPLPVPGVERAGAEVNGAGDGVNGAGAGVNGPGAGVNGAGPGVNRSGAGVNGAGPGVNGAGPGVNLDQFYRTRPAKVASSGRAVQS